MRRSDLYESDLCEVYCIYNKLRMSRIQLGWEIWSDELGKNSTWADSTYPEFTVILNVHWVLCVGPNNVTVAKYT